MICKRGGLARLDDRALRMTAPLEREPLTSVSPESAGAFSRMTRSSLLDVLIVLAKHEAS